jgi:hypothetical protein
MRPIIGRLTRDNWVAHVSLVLAAAAAAAVLASHAEGELVRKVITAVLWVLVVMLIFQPIVESTGGRHSYRFPYAICAAASIIMLEGQSMTSVPVVTGTAEVSGILFAIGIIWLAFQVRGLLRSP